MNQSRRQSRILALNMLYAFCVNENQNKDFIISSFNNFKEDLDFEDLSYSKVLFTVVLDNVDQIDNVLKNAINNWDYSRVNQIDKNLLRLACGEVIVGKTPKNVIINEVIEIGKIFGDSNTHGFINGILDVCLSKFEI